MGRSPCCENAHTNKGAWTKEEDQRLINYIRVHGEGRWRSLPKVAGLLRCGKSCRLRWINYLMPDLKRGNFTEEEDEIIIKLHSLLGNKWSLIAARLPGRNDNDIKNYWNTQIKRKFISRGIDPQTHRPLNATAAAAFTATATTAAKTETSRPQTVPRICLDFRNSTAASPSVLETIPPSFINEQSSNKFTTDNSADQDSTNFSSGTTEETQASQQQQQFQQEQNVTDYDPDGLDFLEICTTSSALLVSKHLEGSKMMQHDSLHPHVGGTYDEMRSSIPEPVGPPSPVLRSELQHLGGMIQGETHGEVPIEPNTLINEENIVTGVQSTKIRAENTLDVQYEITLEVLQRYQGMKLQDAADKLGVSRSTLKRIRKKHGIKRWHHNRSRKTSSHQDAFNPPNQNADAHSMTQDGSSITVKAKYGECTWKFQLLLSAKKMDLERQLVERLNSPVGSFKIHYLDEEDEWISISCDADLKLSIDTCRSQGKTTIRMLVEL